MIFTLQAYVFVTFWFQLYNGFSASIMFDSMYLMMYNLLWTSLPPMAIGKITHILLSKFYIKLQNP